MSPGKNWFSKHSSVGFVLWLLLLSLLLLGFGEFLNRSSSPIGKIAGVVLLQLSGSAVAALIVALFFSFKDVRDQIAASAASLLSSGELIDTLSESARAKLEEQIILKKLGNRVVGLEPSLIASLDQLRNRVLTAHYLQNFIQEVTLTPHRDDPRLLFRRLVRHFRVRSYHLAPNLRQYPFRFYTEIGLPEGIDFDNADLLREFEVVVGSAVLTREHIKIERELSGSLPVLTITCEADLAVDRELDVRITISTLGSVRDTTELLIARYPTLGFHASVKYMEDMYYDCAWFKSWDPEVTYRIGRQSSHKFPNGMSVSTNDWVLPGEGVAFAWYRTEPEPLSAAAAADVQVQKIFPGVSGESG
ncbi:MAG TPA: hypothetical protein VHG91_09365 [Longimicrobium sp.]|nr:hypothetical protein [Longimicrobium sp.]